MAFADLQSFIAHLERQGQLKRVKVEVDPRFEVAEIVQRVIRQDGPALLFERVKGADFPLVMNMFGSHQRIEMALGRPPEQIGQELITLVQQLNQVSDAPPTAWIVFLGVVLFAFIVGLLAFAFRAREDE